MLLQPNANTFTSHTALTNKGHFAFATTHTLNVVKYIWAHGRILKSI